MPTPTILESETYMFWTQAQKLRRCGDPDEREEHADDLELVRQYTESRLIRRRIDRIFAALLWPANSSRATRS